jgi:propionyl-CoA carboxylase beta chain
MMKRLSVYERINMLLDKDSFKEIDSLVKSRLMPNIIDKPNGDGVITGYGCIDGRLVFVYCQDFNIYGGSLGEMHGIKIAKLMDMAIDNKAPIIGLIDSGGARIQEGVLALDRYGVIFRKNANYSGIVPQISVILGACAGGAVYSSALTDFVFMVKQQSQMFITGPKVLEVMTGERKSRELLGGTIVHAHISGVCHYVGESEQEVLQAVCRLLRYLPQNYLEKPPIQQQFKLRHLEQIDKYANFEKLQNISCLPIDATKSYDMRDIILGIADDKSFMEMHEHFAKNVIIGFATIGGIAVGIVANQPKVLAGALDVDASDKIARFVRFNDCFNIPIITLVDVPGFMPGAQQEGAGIIRHGAKILYAYAEATVLKISVLIRKAFGGAYVALNSKGLGADIVYAWPMAEIAVMGNQGKAAVNKLFADSYEANCENIYTAASYGMIDEIIEPKQTRVKIYEDLTKLSNKQQQQRYKKHGNIPL